MAGRNHAILALAALVLGGTVLPSLAHAQGVQDPAAQPMEVPTAHLLTSDEAVQLANWVVASRDNGPLPFIVIDKTAAAVLVYGADGQMLGATPALMGVAKGDDSTPGIGERDLSSMGPAERTTPAGRFVARIGPAKGGQKVLWVDFETSVALHPVVTTAPKERRLKRLQSPTPKDNRITYGCINVPATFFENVVSPLFADTPGVVYILPETKYLIEVFPAFQLFAPPILRSAESASHDG